jgi:hypothetical protein
LSTRINVPVPPGVARIQVQSPRIGDSGQEPLFWRPVGETRWTVVSHDEAIAVQGAATMEIALRPVGATRTATRRVGQSRLAPAARRLLTEVRDRALPSIHRIVHGGRSSRLG